MAYAQPPILQALNRLGMITHMFTLGVEGKAAMHRAIKATSTVYSKLERLARGAPALQGRDRRMPDSHFVPNIPEYWAKSCFVQFGTAISNIEQMHPTIQEEQQDVQDYRRL